MAAAPRRPAQLCGLVNQNPIPYLISEAIFSNLGGTATTAVFTEAILRRLAA